MIDRIGPNATNSDATSKNGVAALRKEGIGKKMAPTESVAWIKIAGAIVR